MINLQTHYASSTPLTIRPYFIYSDEDLSLVEESLLYVFPSRIELYGLLNGLDITDSNQTFSAINSTSVELVYRASYPLSHTPVVIETVDIGLHFLTSLSRFKERNVDCCVTKSAAAGFGLRTPQLFSGVKFIISSLIICLSSTNLLSFLTYNKESNSFLLLSLHHLNLYDPYVLSANKSAYEKKIFFYHKKYSFHNSSIEGFISKLRYILGPTTGGAQMSESSSELHDTFFSQASCPLTVAVQLNSDFLSFISLTLNGFKDSDLTQSYLLNDCSKPSSCDEFFQNDLLNFSPSTRPFCLSAHRDFNLKSLIDFCFVDAMRSSSVPTQAILCLLGSSSPLSTSCIPSEAGSVYLLVVCLDVQLGSFNVIRRCGSFPTSSFLVLPLILPSFSFFSTPNPPQSESIYRSTCVLLVLSKYIVMVVSLLDKFSRTIFMEDVFSEFVQITDPRSLCSTRLAELCLYISEASINTSDGELLRRSLTFEQMTERLVSLPQLGKQWVFNRPTLDVSSIQLDLTEYHWVTLNCFFHLLVPKNSGPFYTASLMVDPYSMKFYGFAFNLVTESLKLSDLDLIYCDTEPAVLQKPVWSDRYKIIFPGHVVDGVPPAIWELSLSFVDNMFLKPLCSESQEISCLIKGHRGQRIKFVDPCKIHQLVQVTSFNFTSSILKGSLIGKDKSSIETSELKIHEPQDFYLKTSALAFNLFESQQQESFDMLYQTNKVRSALVSVALFGLRSMGEISSEPHIGFPRDSVLLYPPTMFPDSCGDLVLGVITGRKNYSRLVEMRFSVGCSSALVTTHSGNSQSTLEHPIPVSFEYPTHLWALPYSVSIDDREMMPTVLAVITSDPSKDIGRTDTYTLTSSHSSNGTVQSSEILAETFTEGFDFDSATVGCGTLMPFVLDGEIYLKFPIYFVWVQVTPTEIRCINPHRSYDVIEPTVSFLDLEPHSSEATQTYVDASLAVYAVVVRNVIAVLLESFHIYFWFLDMTVFRKVCIEDDTSSSCNLLNSFNFENTSIHNFLTQPFRSFHITTLNGACQKAKAATANSDRLLLDAFFDLYLTVVPMYQPSLVFIISLFDCQVVFMCSPSISKEILFNEYTSETFIQETFEKKKNGSLFLNSSVNLDEGIARAEMVRLNPRDEGPTLIILISEVPLLVYRGIFLRNSRTSLDTKYIGFSYRFEQYHPKSFVLPNIKLFPSKKIEEIPLNVNNPALQDFACILALCRFGNLVEHFTEHQDLNDISHVSTESLSLLRIPKVEEDIEEYRLDELILLATKCNKLFLHRLQPTPESSRTRCLTPYPSVSKCWSWLAVSDNFLLRIHSIAPFLPLEQPKAVSFCCTIPMTQIHLLLEYCVKAAFEKDLKLLACADLHNSLDEKTVLNNTAGKFVSKTSFLKIFDVGANLNKRMFKKDDERLTLSPFGEYSFETSERICSVAFVKNSDLCSVIAAGTCLYTDTIKDSVLGRVYILDCPVPSPCESMKTQMLTLRVVQLFPGPVLCLGTLCLPRLPPLLVHTAGRKLFVNKLTGSGLSNGAFFDCPTCVVAMASVKSYFIIADATTGPHFVMFRFNEDTRCATQPFSLLARVSPPETYDGVLRGLAVEYISIDQTLYIITCHSSGVIDVLQYPTKSSSVPQNANQSCIQTQNKPSTPYLTHVTSLGPLNGESSVLRFHRIEAFEPRRIGCLAVTSYGGIHSLHLNPTSLISSVP